MAESANQRKAKERKVKRALGLIEIPRIGWVHLDDVPKIKAFSIKLAEAREKSSTS